MRCDRLLPRRCEDLQRGLARVLPGLKHARGLHHCCVERNDDVSLDCDRINSDAILSGSFGPCLRDKKLADIAPVQIPPGHSNSPSSNGCILGCPRAWRESVQHLTYGTKYTFVRPYLCGVDNVKKWQVPDLKPERAACERLQSKTFHASHIATKSRINSVSAVRAEKAPAVAHQPGRTAAGVSHPVAKATRGKAGTAEVTGLVRRSTAGKGLRVGVASAVLPATSEFMDVTVGETARVFSEAPCHLSFVAATTARNPSGLASRVMTRPARARSGVFDGPGTNPTQSSSSEKPTQMLCASGFACSDFILASFESTAPHESGVGPDAANRGQSHLQAVTGGESAATNSEIRHEDLQDLPPVASAGSIPCCMLDGVWNGSKLQDVHQNPQARKTCAIERQKESLRSIRSKGNGEATRPTCGAARKDFEAHMLPSVRSGNRGPRLGRPSSGLFKADGNRLALSVLPRLGAPDVAPRFLGGFIAPSSTQSIPFLANSASANAVGGSAIDVAPPASTSVADSFSDTSVGGVQVGWRASRLSERLPAAPIESAHAGFADRSRHPTLAPISVAPAFAGVDADRAVSRNVTTFLTAAASSIHVPLPSSSFCVGV